MLLKTVSVWCLILRVNSVLSEGGVEFDVDQYVVFVGDDPYESLTHSIGGVK